MEKVAVILICSIAAISALPTNDPAISKWDSESVRYSYLEDGDGKPHLVDNWLKLSDLEKMARYNPDVSNQYHLFTRANPTTSQPLVTHDLDRLRSSNFNPARRTVVLMHGFMGSVTSEFNSVLVPAYLAAADCNVIVLDWSSGSAQGPLAAVAGQAGARFINWLNSASGATPGQYSITGYSFGGHGAGIMARSVNGNVGFVTGLDPPERWSESSWPVIRPSDGQYTEVIHTSTMGEISPMGHVDFYPNGGTEMPGCLTSLCNHLRSFYFLAESLQRGGFTGRRCLNLDQAINGNCNQAGTLRMGGIEPKTGNSGIFHLTTNKFQPFSQG